MSGYFIQIPSTVLNREDIDSTDKLILGYIATRLNIPEMEWSITKADVAKQLGISHQTAGRKIQPLVEMNVLTLESVKDRGLEIYAVNREVFGKLYQISNLDICQTSKLDTSDVQTGQLQMSKVDGITKIRKELRLEQRDNPKSKASSIDEVLEFCRENGICESDAQYLWDNWEENGWKRGPHKIKDWRRVTLTWQRNGFLPSQRRQKPKQNQPLNYQP